MKESHITIGYESPTGLSGFKEMILENLKGMAPENLHHLSSLAVIEFEGHSVTFSLEDGVRFQVGRLLKTSEWAPWEDITMIMIDYIHLEGGPCRATGGQINILKADFEMQVVLGERDGECLISMLEE